MRWFTGKDFPWDSLVDPVDGDMILETLLNDKSKDIQRKMNLQNFINVPNPFDVVCPEKKLAANERPMLEQTTDVVTQPSDVVVNLDVVPLNQAPSVASAPSNTRKRSPRVDDSLVPVSSNLPPADISKPGEFVHGTISGAPKSLLLGSLWLGLLRKPRTMLDLNNLSPREILRFLLPTHLHLRELDSAETRCKDRFYASMSVDPSVAKDIYRSDSELTNDFIMDKGPMCHSFVDHLATPGDSVKKLEVEVERLNKIVNEKPSGDMARLRLGFEEAKKEVLHLKKLVENLKVEANKVSGLMAFYAQKETHLTTLNAKFQDLLREKEQVELRNASLRGFNDRVVALDAWLDKMAKETDEEFALMLRDAKATKEFLIGKGFRNFLNKFKESDILGARFGACISAAIVDGMRQGLEAVFVHGKRGMDLNSIPTYDINATEVYADALKHGC
ncbi:hypothetical protein Tco_1425251 [Tanacetum coccineum]